MSAPPRLQQLPSLSGRAYLLMAVVIFAAANAVTRRLTDLGAQNLMDGRNPISFCNVLFVGNLVALVALGAVYRQALLPSQWLRLKGSAWLSLMAVAILSGALAPALFFLALEQTSVNNVVLVGRIEPPLTLALSVLLLGARVNRWTIAGAVVSTIGVGLTVLLPQPASTMVQTDMVQTGMVQMGGLAFGQGELMAIAGAVAAAIATIISKVSLEQVPLGLFSLVRTGIGTIVFFVAVIVLFEPSHFQDAFSPFVWQWMVGYGVIIVAGGQLAWFQGLKTSRTAEIALANSFSPIAGILAAFLILGDAPTMAQYIGGTVVLVGIGLNQWGSMRSVVPPPPLMRPEAETGMGFRGI
ncbi:DMT family transporter [Nodosilinea sp. LEGE 07088]|uniref:DMT family transporter n=1 Tax=Nodosilinea sp. LEGE 07088 TaxID=2777968 RepID=UPI0018809FDA|nr:DMT family transporter [Nodosilinea sp. LEGE 07088]MBE9138378.1 DMT family transporter [Nodosilinea sp. LEGE 07088]